MRQLALVLLFVALLTYSPGRLLGQEPHRRSHPELHPEDEGFLLEMREQLRGDTPDLLRDASPEQRLEWFQNGLRQSAAGQSAYARRTAGEAPSWLDAGSATGRGRPIGGPPLGQPKPWRHLLEAAMHLENVAHGLDQQKFWASADEVRQAAAVLRKKAQTLSSEGRHAPHDETRDPRNREN